MLKSKLLKLMATVLTVCLIAIPFGCTQQGANGNEFFSSVIIAQANGDVTFTPTLNASPSEGVEIPLLSGDIYTVSKNYKLFITDGYNPNKEDIFAPTPLTISWTSQQQPLYYTFEISTNGDMTDAKSYVTLDSNITLENLFMGYDYYYQICAKFENKIIKSRIFNFSTEYLPRTVYIDDNVSNTRDWGGYYCEDEIHRVKQGIVYRGGQLETISLEGKRRMIVSLGIKTDLDVRGDGSGSLNSPLGSSVNYIEATGPYYAIGEHGINFSLNLPDQHKETQRIHKESLIKEIKTFVNPKNFPIYIHCSLGRDRTGTLCFLINALLGVSEMDLYRDYELSMMSKKGKTDGQTAQSIVGGAFTTLYNFIKNYKNADSLSDGARMYMIDLGITEEEIEAIKANMLEEI